MSMYSEFTAAVLEVERQLNDQIAKLNYYLSELDNVTAKINNALSDSPQDYDQQMIDKASITKEKVMETIQNLQIAINQLDVSISG